MARLAYLFDSSKCMGCHGCQVSCKQWNQEKALKTHFEGSFQNPPKLSVDTRMIMKFYENFEKDTIPQLNILKYQCFHCGEPACVKVCPSGALTKTSTGIVAMDQSKCIACGYCHNACPYNIPEIGEHVNKCDMCLSRTENGNDKDKTSTPACVKACPAGAMEFGDRDALIAKAKSRVEWLKGRGVSTANVYGDQILGGLGIISILKADPVKYGLPTNPSVPVEVTIWKDVLNPLGLLAFVGAFCLAGFKHILALKQAKIDEQKGIDHDDTHKGKGVSQ